MHAAQVLDEYFIENRTRILEIAAFLDRLDRAEDAGGDVHGGGRDFRCRAFAEALHILAAPGRNRLDRIQMLLSDPSVEALPALDRKSAIGAYDHWRDGSSASAGGAA